MFRVKPYTSSDYKLECYVIEKFIKISLIDKLQTEKHCVVFKNYCNICAQKNI